MYHFDNENREVIIEKYNTPTPWMNYLSNGTFHTMMSQAGGGVAFYRSPQIWRINHYRFFHLPTDRSGFYTYIKDGETIWCPTNEPCHDKPQAWSAAHGMGYTRFEARKDGLDVSALYLVGKYENALVWQLKFWSDRDRHITLFPYVELGMMEFMRELQWQCYNCLLYTSGKHKETYLPETTAAVREIVVPGEYCGWLVLPIRERKGEDDRLYVIFAPDEFLAVGTGKELSLIHIWCAE